MRALDRGHRGARGILCPRRGLERRDQRERLAPLAAIGDCRGGLARARMIARACLCKRDARERLDMGAAVADLGGDLARAPDLTCHRERIGHRDHPLGRAIGPEDGARRLDALGHAPRPDMGARDLGRARVQAIDRVGDVV
ncbi:MAG: hypothetical protein ACO3XL_11515, partial [Gemmobacter sp.]